MTNTIQDSMQGITEAAHKLQMLLDGKRDAELFSRHQTAAQSVTATYTTSAGYPQIVTTVSLDHARAIISAQITNAMVCMKGYMIPSRNVRIEDYEDLMAVELSVRQGK